MCGAQQVAWGIQRDLFLDEGSIVAVPLILTQKRFAAVRAPPLLPVACVCACLCVCVCVHCCVGVAKTVTHSHSNSTPTHHIDAESSTG
jgi:hypothetical protein